MEPVPEVDLATLPIAFLEAYPFPALILLTAASPLSKARPRFRTRDTDVTVRNIHGEISPFSEAPENDVTPPSEREEPLKVIWSNDKWKMVARNQGLNDLENELDLLAWVQDGPVDRVYNLGFRHSSTRFQVVKTRVEGQNKNNNVTILTAQSTFTPAPPEMMYSPIMEVDEFELDPALGERRTTIGPNRLSTSTELSTASTERAGSVASSGESYFPPNSSRSSSGRVRSSRNSKRSVGDRAEAYTAQMNSATTTCWQMVEAVDWNKTKLGPRSAWNELYEGLMAIVFQSPSQDALWLGEDLQIIHNVPYIGLLEGRQVFGRPGRETWAIIWDYLRPLLDQALAGEAVYRENDLVLFKSYGAGTLQEGYHHWRFVPIRDKTGSVIGLYNQSLDTTDQVLAERRLSTVRNLSEQMLVVRSLKEYYDSIIEVLEENPKDAPFALCYSVHPKKAGETSGDVDIHLERTLGVPENDLHATATTTVNIPPKFKSLFGASGPGLSSPTLSAISALSSGSGSIRAHIYAEGQSWPIQRALATRQCVIVQDCRELIQGYPIRVWDELPVSAIVIPICSDSSNDIPESVLILGLNVRRPFDEDYDSWVHVIRSHLASSHTSVKAVEAEKRRIEEEVRMEKAKTAWLRGAANDIRGPLALVSGPLDDVLRSDLTPKQKHSLMTAKRNTSRLLRLVDALTDLSRLEAGSVQGRFVPTDLGVFVTDLAELFRPAIEKLGVSLEFDIEKSAKLVYVDPTLFETMVSNLIGNAIKYTEHGSITIQIRFADFAEISVIDTGVGIPKNELDLITAAFHHTSTVVHPGFQSTGLGLSIVREIVHLHDGQLHVSSATLAEFEEQGSTFTAKIPLKERHSVSADVGAPVFGKYGAALAGEAMRWQRGSGTSTGASSDTGNESTLGSKVSDGMLFEAEDTLLVVDNNSDMREYIRSIFSPYCKVVEAVNGEDARRLAFENPPTLILADILLPKLSGMELLSAIRENSSTAITPVVMLSAVAGEEARLDALFFGAEDYLTKPFKPKELLARVHLHMQVGKKRRQLEEMYTQRQTELSLLSDYCPAGIMRATADGTLIYANEAWRKMAGMGPNEDPADWPNYVDAENKAHLYDVWPKFFNGDLKDTRFSWKWLNGRSSAGVFVRLDKVSPGMSGILGCINDTTHEEMRIVEAERRRQEAEESKHQQELLVDLTSHEIRTPVSAILQCSSLVKENLVALFEQLKLTQAVGFRPTKELLSDLAEDIEALESIYQCGLVQERIAGDVLSLARIQLDMLSLHDVETDLKKEAKKILSVFASEAKMKRIELQLRFGSTLEKSQMSKIKTDHVRLGQVVTNLISNAIRFTAASDIRNITVQYDVSFVPPEEDTCALPASIGIPDNIPVAEDTPLWLFVSVRDTGPGLKPNELAILFKRFSQGNKMIHTRYGGSGLGLFICRKITELLGGRIEVKSDLGQGSVFRFFIKTTAAAPKSALAQYVEDTSSLAPATPLPGGHMMISPNPSSQSIPTVMSAATPTAESLTDLTHLHILIVEDNIINQTVLKRQIIKAGLTCDVANHGLEALTLIREADRQSRRAGAKHKVLYDCVLMDLEMPVMDGLTAVREIRDAERAGTLTQQMVIALTGNARQGQIDQAMEAGMDDVVIKPYVLSQLLKKIRAMFTKRAEARAMADVE